MTHNYSVRQYDKNSWCTMAKISKKTVIICFICDRFCIQFWLFGQRPLGRLSDRFDVIPMFCHLLTILHSSVSLIKNSWVMYTQRCFWSKASNFTTLYCHAFHTQNTRKNICLERSNMRTVSGLWLGDISEVFATFVRGCRRLLMFLGCHHL